jgi:DNA invertase Pin-like site-specific DNA recombinase
MKLGYARVSTEDQTLDLQRPRLLAVGCEKLFEEKISGAKRNRPELEKLLGEVRKKDILVVTRLDRLARSTVELLAIAERLREKDTGLQSLDEPWVDTESPSGRMILTVFAGIAEFERALYSAANEGWSCRRPQARRRLRQTTKNATGSTSARTRTHQSGAVHQPSRQDLQRPSRNHLSLPRGVRGLVNSLCRFSVPLSRTGPH